MHQLITVHSVMAHCTMLKTKDLDREVFKCKCFEKILNLCVTYYY